MRAEVVRRNTVDRRGIKVEFLVRGDVEFLVRGDHETLCHSSTSFGEAHRTGRGATNTQRPFLEAMRNLRTRQRHVDFFVSSNTHTLRNISSQKKRRLENPSEAMSIRQNVLLSYARQCRYGDITGLLREMRDQGEKDVALVLNPVLSEERCRLQ